MILINENGVFPLHYFYSRLATGVENIREKTRIFVFISVYCLLRRLA